MILNYKLKKSHIVVMNKLKCSKVKRMNSRRQTALKQGIALRKKVAIIKKYFSSLQYTKTNINIQFPTQVCQKKIMRIFSQLLD